MPQGREEQMIIIPYNVFVTQVGAGSRPEGIVDGLGLVRWIPRLESSIYPDFTSDRRDVKPSNTFFNMRYDMEISPVVKWEEASQQYELITDFPRVNSATVIPLHLLLPSSVGAGAALSVPRASAQDYKNMGSEIKNQFGALLFMMTARILDDCFGFQDMLNHQARGTSTHGKSKKDVNAKPRNMLESN